jgi:3,4-dihydroxy 2-butanone 4-phosphate synthase/GTP cyclohydrolase II|tara:strand:- start:1789 stop:3024 length:1236 start_codon:yes stop_codon:yes gene_type:complete
MTFATVKQAIEAIAAGKMIILVDDPRRENEGDLVMAAEHITADGINFMRKEGGGLICLTLEGDLCDQLDLRPQVANNTSSMGTAFLESIEAKEGVTTGISAADRATTILAAVADGARPSDLARPGHIFPLRARKGGVLRRPGQTEGSVDLARMANVKGAGVICEIMNDDGTMARMPDLEIFAKKHELIIITVEDLVKYRHEREKLITREVSGTPLPTKFGDFSMHLYKSHLDGKEHFALCYNWGDSPVDDEQGFDAVDEDILVRVHSECLTGDLLGSLRCDCGPQFQAALSEISSAGKGVLLYIRQEGRGIGLANKLRAYKLQDEGLDTIEANEKLGYPADMRDYGIGAQILHDLGVRRMKLLTNNPKKLTGLAGYELEITAQIPLSPDVQEHNAAYLKTKRDKMGHSIEL